METCGILISHFCLGTGSQVAAYFLIALGMLVEGEIFLLVAGSFAHLGFLDLNWVLLSAFLGTITGDVLWYKVGAHWGRKFIEKHGHFFLLPPERFLKIEKMILAKGVWLIFLSKFMYGLNHTFLVVAGAVKLNFKKFLKYQVFVSAFWVVLFVFLGSAFALSLNIIKKDVRFFGLALIVLIALVLFLEKVIKKVFWQKLFGEKEQKPDQGPKRS